MATAASQPAGTAGGHPRLAPCLCCPLPQSHHGTQAGTLGASPSCCCRYCRWKCGVKSHHKMTAVKNKKIKSKTPSPLILFPFNRVNVPITELWAVQCPGQKGLAMTPGTKDVPPQLPRNLASPCSEDVKGVYRRASRGHLRCRRQGEGHQLPRGTRPEGSQRLGIRCPQKVAACLRNLNAIPLFVP